LLRVHPLDFFSVSFCNLSYDFEKQIEKMDKNNRYLPIFKDFSEPTDAIDRFLTKLILSVRIEQRLILL
jgi:hypothetical protein